MPNCDKCKYLQGVLDKERKELVKLREQVARVSDRAKDRKKLLDKVTGAQEDAAKAVESAVSYVMRYLTMYAPQEVQEWASKHSVALRNRAREALDTYKDEKKYKVRKREEHAMPRHGKYSS